MKQTSVADARFIEEPRFYSEPESMNLAADPVFAYMTKKELEKAIKETEKAMHRAAKEMEFMEAARLRDQIDDLKRKMATAE